VALVDGWFHTGDVGRLDEDGYLRITDRKKDLIVTAAGKNVAPQPIESQLKATRFVAEVVLIGDRRRYISALIVPQFANLEAHARTLGFTAESPSDLARMPEIVREFETLVGELNARLSRYERIKRFCLLERELELESGEITPTMKVKRNVIANAYADRIEAMYTEPAPAGIGCPPTHDTAEATPLAGGQSIV
jgi:long-chain acyl-CoA synthetase